MKKKVYYSRLKGLVESDPETRNMNVTQIANFIGVTRATIYNWFTAENKPFKERPDETAEKIAVAFNLPDIESAYRIEEVEIKRGDASPELMPGAAPSAA